MALKLDMKKCVQASLLVARASLLVSRTLLVAPGITTRSKKLLVTNSRTTAA